MANVEAVGALKGRTSPQEQKTLNAKTDFISETATECVIIFVKEALCKMNTKTSRLINRG